MSETRTLILGTAGHVDHGKTTLVRALTGTDTDRLEEEHRRGISIELGFAHLDLGGGLSLGIVDVPGHERFVRQMVAGAGGMDLAMLLIAGDEGVMPQTREHFDVLRMLGVPAGLVVLTKIDVADPELVEVIEEEIAELVEGSFLEGAPVVRVSGTTGEGIDALRETLVELVHAQPERLRGGDFRLPVDRVFVLAGTGVVVTGTAWSGRVKVGDSLRLLPSGQDVRVRDVQNHGRSVESAGAGSRVALALHGVKKEDVDRGEQLVGGSAWQKAQVLGVELQTVADPILAARMRTRARVHVHLAAREVIGRLDPLSGDGPMAPGETRLARLLLDEPLVARPGDRFVLRTYSPMYTAAGGRVLDPSVAKGERRAITRERLERYQAGEPLDWAFDSGLDGRPERELRDRLSMLGLESDAIEEEIGRRLSAGTWIRVGDRLVAAEGLDALANLALKKLRKHQTKKPLTLGLPREELRQTVGFDGNSHQFARVLEALAARHPIFVRGDRIRADQADPPIDDAQREALEAMEARVRAAVPLFEATEDDLRNPVLRMLVEGGRVVRLEGRILAHRARLDELAARVGEHFATEEILDISHLKEWTGASRKFVVPILEWFDRAEVTRFAQGKRRRGPRCP